MYQTVAHAERSGIQFPSAEPKLSANSENYSGQPIANGPRVPTTPPKPSMIPRLRRMASFNDKRDMLTSPATPPRQMTSYDYHRQETENFEEWGSPAPKYARTTLPRSTPRRTTNVTGIMIILTPPSDSPDTTEDTMRTPYRRLPAYDRAYLSPPPPTRRRRVIAPPSS